MTMADTTNCTGNNRSGSPTSPRGCLGRTCLKWRADGELTALDLELVLERLAQVDRGVAELQQLSRGREPCALSS